MSSASRCAIPSSRAFSRMASTKLVRRSYTISGELTWLSSSRRRVMALKHSEVIWLTRSMTVGRGSGRPARDGEQLELHVGRVEGGRQIDRDQAILEDLLPVVVLKLQREIGDPGADGDLGRRAVRERYGHPRRGGRSDHERKLRARRDLAQPGQAPLELRVRRVGSD